MRMRARCKEGESVQIAAGKLAIASMKREGQEIVKEWEIANVPREWPEHVLLDQLLTSGYGFEEAEAQHIYRREKKWIRQKR